MEAEKKSHWTASSTPETGSPNSQCQGFGRRPEITDIQNGNSPRLNMTSGDELASVLEFGHNSICYGSSAQISFHNPEPLTRAQNRKKRGGSPK